MTNDVERLGKLLDKYEYIIRTQDVQRFERRLRKLRHHILELWNTTFSPYTLINRSHTLVNIVEFMINRD